MPIATPEDNGPLIRFLAPARRRSPTRNYEGTGKDLSTTKPPLACPNRGTRGESGRVTAQLRVPPPSPCVLLALRNRDTRPQFASSHHAVGVRRLDGVVLREAAQPQRRDVQRAGAAVHDEFGHQLADDR